MRAAEPLSSHNAASHKVEPLSAASAATNSTTRQRSSFAFPKAGLAKPKAPQSAGFVHASGERTPEYTLVHSGQLDLADAWSDATVHSAPMLPRELIAKIALPGVTSATSAELDVLEQHITLTAATTYRLELRLPHKVRAEKARARFDKGTQQLVVTMPVLPPPAPAQASRAATAYVCEVPSDAGGEPAAEPQPADAAAAAQATADDEAQAGAAVEVPAHAAQAAEPCNPAVPAGAEAARDGSTAPVAVLEPFQPSACSGCQHADANNSALEQCSEGSALLAGASDMGASHTASATDTDASTLDADCGALSGLHAAAASWSKVHAERDTADAPAHMAAACSSEDCGPASKQDATATEATNGGGSDHGSAAQAHARDAEQPCKPEGVKLDMTLDFAFIDELD